MCHSFTNFISSAAVNFVLLWRPHRPLAVIGGPLSYSLPSLFSIWWSLFLSRQKRDFAMLRSMSLCVRSRGFSVVWRAWRRCPPSLMFTSWSSWFSGRYLVLWWFSLERGWCGLVSPAYVSAYGRTRCLLVLWFIMFVSPLHSCFLSVVAWWTVVSWWINCAYEVYYFGLGGNGSVMVLIVANGKLLAEFLRL